MWKSSHRKAHIAVRDNIHKNPILAIKNQYQIISNNIQVLLHHTKKSTFTVVSVTEECP